MQSSSTAGFSKRIYHPPPDISSISPKYSQTSSRSNSQGYDTLVAAQRGNAGMGARKMAETGSVRKKASGVGLGGIFNRKNSTEKKNAKAQAQAVVQAPGQGQAQGHPVVQEAEKPAPKRRGPKPDSKPAMNRRQELNRQAQRTHRERKELYAKSLENNNLLLKEQLANMVKQRDAFCHENGILKNLLRVNNIPYHVSPMAIDMVPQNHTYGTVNAYASPDIDFASTPQANGTRANGYAAPASTYSSSTNTASPSNGLPADLSPDMSNMTLHTTPTTQSSVSEGQNSQLSQHTDYSSATYTTAATSNGNGYANGYVYRNGNNYSTSSADISYSQAVAPSNTASMRSNESSYDYRPLDLHIGQLERQNGISKELYSNQMGNNTSFQNMTRNYGDLNVETDPWGCSFVFYLESSCRDHAKLMIQRGAAHDSTELSGHAMMLSCPPHSYIQDSLNDPDMQYPLQVPTVPRQDFDVMMHSNTTVDMNGEINPVAALLMIRRDRRFPTLTEAELNTIKDELADKSRCYGFGAMLEEYEVNDAMDNITAARLGPAAIAYVQHQRSLGLTPSFANWPDPHYNGPSVAVSNQQYATAGSNHHYKMEQAMAENQLYSNSNQHMYNSGYS